MTAGQQCYVPSGRHLVDVSVLDTTIKNLLTSLRSQVLYVDYGNEEWVTTDRIRPIESCFIHKPCQAIRCRPVCQPLSPDGKWSSNAQ